MDLMKETLKRKMDMMKNKKMHNGDSMHESEMNLDHEGGDSLHEHMKSGSDLAPPIVHGKEHASEHEDELMAEHDLKKHGHPQGKGLHEDAKMKEEAREMGNRSEAHDEDDFEYQREQQILKALGAHNVHNAKSGGSSLSGLVANKAKERFASMEKEKKFGHKKF